MFIKSRRYVMDGMQEYKHLKKYIDMSGLTFVGKYMEEILLKYTYLKNNQNRNEYIHDLLSREPKVTTIVSMTMKVDGLLKIIEMGYATHALALVIASHYVNKNNPEVVEKARETLEKILANNFQNVI
jgi:hypothetical protein